MKTFLTYIILLVFVVVNCAGPHSRRQSSRDVIRTGPNECGQTGWMKTQDAFEKDRQECTESIDKNLDSEAFGKALEGCMGKKGYQYDTSSNAARRTGPNECGQTGWMKTQDAFEKDRQECTESIDKNLDSEAFGKALDECMGKKGYQFQTVEPLSTGTKVLIIAGIIILLPVVAASFLLLGLMGAIGH